MITNFLRNFFLSRTHVSNVVHVAQPQADDCITFGCWLPCHQEMAFYAILDSLVKKMCIMNCAL